MSRGRDTHGPAMPDDELLSSTVPLQLAKRRAEVIAAACAWAFSDVPNKATKLREAVDRLLAAERKYET